MDSRFSFSREPTEGCKLLCLPVRGQWPVAFMFLFIYYVLSIRSCYLETLSNSTQFYIYLIEIQLASIFNIVACPPSESRPSSKPSHAAHLSKMNKQDEDEHTHNSTILL